MKSDSLIGNYSIVFNRDLRANMPPYQSIRHSSWFARLDWSERRLWYLQFIQGFYYWKLQAATNVMCHRFRVLNQMGDLIELLAQLKYSNDNEEWKTRVIDCWYYIIKGKEHLQCEYLIWFEYTHRKFSRSKCKCLRVYMIVCLGALLMRSRHLLVSSFVER